MIRGIEKVTLTDCTKHCIKKNGKPLYYIGLHVAIVIGSMGKKGPVSLKDMKLRRLWITLWGGKQGLAYE